MHIIAAEKDLLGREEKKNVERSVIKVIFKVPAIK